MEVFQNIFCILSLSAIIVLVAITTAVEEEDWQRYLDNKYYYINHFSEMLRRKSDDYHAKRDDYQNWLVNYRETEREDVRTHDETEDEQLEQHHETDELSREKHREHTHNIERQLIEKRTLHDILKTPEEAKTFLKTRLPTNRRRR